jgi:hypothetical protein
VDVDVDVDVGAGVGLGCCMGAIVHTRPSPISLNNGP